LSATGETGRRPIRRHREAPDVHEFVLVSDWRIPAPIEAVWAALHDVEKWPKWWPYVKQVTEIEPVDADGVGARRAFVWATRLPYRIAFEMRTTRVRRPVLMEGRASGDLNGTGRWDLELTAYGTRVRYEWRVSADKPWMRRLAPLLRPVYLITTA
jgi:carbon monoxide dehydrogenase subunit G